jgi:hypothetical protein
LPPPATVGRLVNLVRRGSTRHLLNSSASSRRKFRVGKPCSRRESQPIPAQPGSAMTGLSSRRSRVESRRSRKVPANRIFCRPRRHERPPVSMDPASIPHESPGFAASFRSHTAPLVASIPR